MKKVYVVTFQDFYDRMNIDRVFINEQDAIDYVKIKNNEKNNVLHKRYNFDYDEYTIS